MKLERIIQEDIRREVLVEGALITHLIEDLVNLVVRKVNLSIDQLEQEMSKKK